MNTIHNMITRLAKNDYLPVDYNTEDPYMIQDICGITFNNPITLSPGIDVNCDGPHAFIKLGFGAVEIGTISIEPEHHQSDMLSSNNTEEVVSVMTSLNNHHHHDNDNYSVVSKVLLRLLNILSSIFTRNTAEELSSDTLYDSSIIKRDMATFSIYYPSEEYVRNKWSSSYSSSSSLSSSHDNKSIGVHEISKRLDGIDFTPDLVRIGRIGISIKASTSREVRIGVETLADKVDWISLDCRHIENDVVVLIMVKVMN